MPASLKTWHSDLKFCQSLIYFSGLSRSRCVREEGGYGDNDDYEEEGQQPVPRTALTLVPTEGHPAPKAILAGCLLEVSVQGDTIMTLINLTNLVVLTTYW